jgi:uncharacterized protein (TIGR02996 family)
MLPGGGRGPFFVDRRTLNLLAEPGFAEKYHDARFVPEAVSQPDLNTMHDAFLADVIAHPEDDTPRLIYADWLEENGGEKERERAEFIRGQVRLAKVSAWDEGAVELDVRCRYLLRANRDEWLAPLAGVPTNPLFWDEWHLFSRGFLERVEMSARAFLNSADRLSALGPIRGLAIHPPWPRTDEQDIPEEFWSCAATRRLRQLWIYRHNLPHADPLTGPALATGEWSVVNFAIHSRVVEQAGEALANAAFAPNLRRLEIASNVTGPVVWRPLWQSQRLPNLKRFGFRTRTNLADLLSVDDLLSAPWLAGLERLELAGKGYRDAPVVMADLARLLRSAPLRALVLERCRIPRQAAHGLRALPAVPLEHLVLGAGCEIGKRALRALLLSPGLTSLRSFALSGNGKVVLTCLLESPLRESLRILDLSGCDVPGVVRLAGMGCPQLVRLTLRFPDGAGDALRTKMLVDALLDPEAFPRLASLALVGPPQVIPAVARHPGAARLLEFHGETDSAPDDLRLICESPSLSSSISLTTRARAGGESRLEREQVADLKQRLGPRLDDSRSLTDDADCG